MSEQIVLEFIGKTAGLNKAIEAMQKIKGIADEQLALFRRLNSEQQQWLQQQSQGAQKTIAAQNQAGAGAEKLSQLNKNYAEQLARHALAAYSKQLELQKQATKNVVQSANERLTAIDNEMLALNESYKTDSVTFADYQQKKTALATEQSNLRKQTEEDEIKQARELMSTISEGISGAVKLGSALYRTQEEEKLEQLQREREAELSNQNLTASQKAAINEKYRKQEAAIKRKEFEADKAAKIVEAIMATALAIVKALPNPVTAALAGAAGAAQVALISAQPTPRFYAKGGKNLPAGMAIVGEEGPELMYVPQGSSIIPGNDTQALLQKWGVPAFNLQTPAAPEKESAVIDYGKLGDVLAAKLQAYPQHKISIDRNGFTYYVVSKAKRIEKLNSSYEA